MNSIDQTKETSPNLIKLAEEKYPYYQRPPKECMVLSPQREMDKYNEITDVQREAFIKGVQYCIEIVL